MITSIKAKAIVALIISVIVAVGGQVANLQLVSGDAQHTITVVIGILTAVATSLGVYYQPNAAAEG